jgi:hypothetical protein
MKINPKTSEAYQLFHDGTLALQRAESAGIRVDMDYVNEKKIHLTRKINRLENEFKETKFYKEWETATKGKLNINSDAQLRNFLYNVKKLKPAKLTASGVGSTDGEALAQLNIPELNILADKAKIERLRDTNLDGFAREQVNGYLHPFFNLHLARTFRSCVAKGSLVLAVRDFLSYPKGVPIEEIREGDYVYCFDNNLNPAIRKVLWAGKTGHREVIRVYYSIHGRGKGYVDVTPEHLIRLIDGSYVQAQNLIGDFRTKDDDKHIAKIRTLSCARKDDKLSFTGHLKGGKGIHEHRLIYSQLIGDLNDSDLVHHENEIHLDHTPSNLIKMTASEHATLHVINTLQSPISRINNKISIQKSKEAGVYKRSARRGADAFNYLGLSKYTCYRILAMSAGQMTKAEYDFSVFKKYVKSHEIDIQEVKLRYDVHGKYIWKSKLKELSKLGRPAVSKIIGHNYYRLIQLYTLYDIDTKRKWANQFGSFVPGNHTITKIEWIKEIVDVYDIEVEDYHNFFANEICVHNSSSNINFQNIPNRDEESMQVCRRALFARPGNQLMEVDTSGMEVRISACYHKDPTMIKYIKDPKSDLHRDMAQQIFLLDNLDKKNPDHANLRFIAKSAFVFAQFYGDYYKNCAINIVSNWCKLPQSRWKAGQGIPFEGGTISDHMISKGIKSFDAFTDHLKDIEDNFWGVRFAEYAEWKERWYKTYLKYGYLDMYTGFRCSGVISRNDCINYPVQGAAFHCLLWSLIQIDRIQREENWDTRLVGQIHDSLVLDVHPDEAEHVYKTIRRVMCEDLPNAWKWISVPIDVEAKISPAGDSWANMNLFKI